MDFPKNFPVTTTKNGRIVILFTDQGGGIQGQNPYSLIGALYNGGDAGFSPAAWAIDGRKFVDVDNHPLDLILHETTISEGKRSVAAKVGSRKTSRKLSTVD